MSDLSSDFSYLRGAASDINNVAADLSDIVSVAITASSVVEGLSSDFGGLMSAVAATSVGMRAAVDNVTPLAGAFRQLQTQTGAAQTANKSMIAGLAGFIGKVDLASIAVSLLIEYGDDLVRALTSGGESAEELRKRIAGISEYEDLTFTLTVAGMSEMEKLDAKLNIIANKLALIREEQGWQERREALPPKWKSDLTDMALRWQGAGQMGNVGAIIREQQTGIPIAEQLVSEGTRAREALEAEIAEVHKARGEQIKRAIDAASQDKPDYSLLRESFWGQERNEEFLMATGESATQANLLMQEFKALAEEANNAGGKIEELEKDIGGAGKAAENWQVAAEAAKNAMAGIDTQAKTVAQARAELAEAKEKVNAAIQAGETVAHGAMTDQKKLKKATDDVTKATKEYNKVKSETAKVEERWQKAVGKAEAELKVTNKLLGRQKEENLSVEESTKKVIEAEAELIKIKQSNKATDEDVIKAKEKLAEANDDLADSFEAAAKAYADNTTRIVDAIGFIGGAFESVTGSSIQGLGQLTDAVDNLRGDLVGYDESGNPMYEGRNELQGYLGIASFVGQNIGGRVGGAISGAASGALMGLQIAAGNPIGAVIGGAVGLVSSILGGGDYEERRARRDEARQQAFNAIQGMALEGGPLSAELMRQSGWNWRNLSGLRSTPDLLEEYGLSWSRRFMADYGVEGARDRQETVKAIDNLLLSIKSFTDSGFSQSLDKLNIKYEYLAQKSHTPAFVEQARLTDLIQLVTGINADTVVGSVSSALSSAASSGENAGEVFMESFTREILDGVANTAISQMVTNTIMPILEGPLSQIAQSMTAGEEFDASALAEAVSFAKSAAASVAPAVQELYAAFDASGMWAEAMGDDVDEVAEKWTALIEQVTGVSASSVTSNIMSAISSMSDQGGDVGQAFVQNFMDSVMSGLQRYAVDQLVSTVIEPMMAPVMDRIANSISISDGIDEEGLSNALTQAEELAQNVAPFVEDLYAIFSGADMYKKATAAGNQTLDEQIAKAAEEAVRAATMELSAELDAALKKIAELEEQKAQKAASTLQSAAEDAADALRGATEALAEFQSGLFVTAAGSIKSLGTLQAQQSIVDRLVVEAVYHSEEDSRIAAMQDLPGAVRASLATSMGLMTDPLEYSREVARVSRLLGGIVGEQTTMADIQKELRESREENRKLREELCALLKKENDNSDDTVTILRDIQTNGISTI